MKRQRSLLAYLWVSPVSLLGLGLGMLAYGFGATMKRRFGVIEIAGNTRTHWLNKISTRYEAITLGHVILGRKHGVLKAYRRHEHVHVRQYERWGIFLPVMYLLARRTERRNRNVLLYMRISSTAQRRNSLRK
ncbi:MAG: hypothetical protein IPF65_06165 [Polaromonas sp.]|nr:hypothetical protein [Polaromonas sp.]